MKEITVTVDYEGLKYQTNIITNKEAARMKYESRRKIKSESS